ncbi:MAG: flippase [Candidatus Omnitrophota bacterium]
MFFKNKSFRQTIVKNAFWLTFLATIQKGVNFLVVVWIARYLGPGIYGKWAFALSFAGLFSVFVDFGFSDLMVREVTRDKTRTARYIDNIVAMKLVLSMIALGAIAVLIRIMGKDPEIIQLAYFLGLYAMINTFATFFQAVFRANEDMQYETLCGGVQSLSLLGLVAFFIAAGGGLLCISVAYIISSILGCVLSLMFIWGYFSRFFVKIDIAVCKDIFRKVWPLGLTYIFISGYYQIDTVMLSAIKTDIAVGWYNAGSRFLMFLIIIPSLLQGVFFPSLSLSFVRSREKYAAIFEQFFKYMLLISIPVCAGMLMLSERMIFCVFGSEFSRSAAVLQILVWSFLFASIGGVFGSVLNSSNRQLTLAKITGAAFCVNIILNLLLIPKYSYIGASAATNITRFLVVAAEFAVLMEMGLKPWGHKYFRISLKITMATVVMGLFIKLAKDFNLMLVISVSALIYSACIFAVKGLNEIDMKLKGIEQ